MKALVYEGPRKVTVNMALRPTVFVAEDPGSPDDLMKEGKLALDFGQLWLKGQRIANGQANVKAYNRKLRDVIARGKPSDRQLFRMNFLLNRQRKVMSISMPATAAGPR